MKAFKYMIFVWTILSSALFVSCKEDETTSAALTVTRVSTVLDRKAGIEQADLGQYIIVQGTGLDAVKTLLINDVTVDLRDAYVTSDEITFRIPRVIPRDVNNKITVVTEQATATTPISVFIPQIQVAGMYNEFTPAGGIMKIVGDFFDIYELTPEAGKLYFGSQEMEILRATADTISFRLPQNAAVGTKVKLVSPVVGDIMVPGKYRERGNMLCDFESGSGWGGGQYLTNGPVPEPISGQFSRFKLAASAAADWEWSGTVAVAQLGVSYTPDILANQANYALKFEVNTQRTLTKRQIRFYFDQINFDWEPFKAMPFKTNGEWQTVTIDLSKVWKGATPNGTILQILGNSYAEDTDICFDNFRIVLKD